MKLVISWTLSYLWCVCCHSPQRRVSTLLPVITRISDSMNPFPIPPCFGQPPVLAFAKQNVTKYLTIAWLSYDTFYKTNWCLSVMHLSMLSSRVGGGGRADLREFDIFRETGVKFPTPGQLKKVNFQPLECLFLWKSNNWGTVYVQNPYPGDSLVCQFPGAELAPPPPPPPPPPWGLTLIGA